MSCNLCLNIQSGKSVRRPRFCQQDKGPRATQQSSHLPKNDKLLTITKLGQIIQFVWRNYFAVHRRRLDQLHCRRSGGGVAESRGRNKAQAMPRASSAPRAERRSGTDDDDGAGGLACVLCVGSSTRAFLLTLLNHYYTLIC